MRRILSVILAVAVILCFSSCGVTEEKPNTSEGGAVQKPIFTNGAVDWKIDAGVAVFDGADVRMADFNTYEVENRTIPWVPEKENIASVVINDGITYVGNYSFFDFDGISSVKISGTVDSIGSSAFAFCDNLESVALGDGIREIGMGAFGQCVSLREINIPESVTTIGKGAFYDCYSLTDLTIPATVEVFGDADIFTGCTSLTIHCVEGSEAQAQAEKYGIPFDFNI